MIDNGEDVLLTLKNPTKRVKDPDSNSFTRSGALWNPRERRLSLPPVDPSDSWLDLSLDGPEYDERAYAENAPLTNILSNSRQIHTERGQQMVSPTTPQAAGGAVATSHPSDRTSETPYPSPAGTAQSSNSTSVNSTPPPG